MTSGEVLVGPQNVVLMDGGYVCVPVCVLGVGAGGLLLCVHACRHG